MNPIIKSEIKDQSASGGSEMVWDLLSKIPDPEIPVITISDLGVLRDVRLENEKIVVTITPTYSGCPAMKAIESDILSTLKENGIDALVKTIYSPAWTTDWMSEEAKEKLRVYGISPPHQKEAVSSSSKHNCLVPLATGDSIRCPRCNSSNSELISQFGSTACKALYRCKDCKEPFDYFKCH